MATHITWTFSTASSTKGTIRKFLEAYFDGNSHRVSGETTTCPACYVRMFLTSLAQDSYKALNKPEIAVVESPGGMNTHRWISGVTADPMPVVISWPKSTSTTIKGYYVYRSATQLGVYTKVSGLLTGLSYTESPGASTYWYKVNVVAADDSETLHQGAVSRTINRDTGANWSRRSSQVFQIFIIVPRAIGGQRVADQVAGIIRALFCGGQSAYLRSAGIQFPYLSGASELRINDQLAVITMFLRFNVTTEYS